MLSAIQQGDVRRVALLAHLGIPTNSDVWLEGGVLHCAAAMGQTNVMAKLLELGANINRWDGYGDTPADAAVFGGQTNALRWLLAHGENPSIKNRDGYTVAQYITNSMEDESHQAELLSILKEATNNPSSSPVVPN
jgi:ankyrin repeat protein